MSSSKTSVVRPSSPALTFNVFPFVTTPQDSKDKFLSLVETNSYKLYGRPLLASMLEKLNIDKFYHRAQGNYLYTYDLENKEEIKIFDGLGGFGQLILGHNHPKIVKKLRECIESQIPFASQVSNQVMAGKLAEKLHHLFRQKTGKSYFVTLGNSGAEVVEAAIKHAELRSLMRIQDQLQKFDHSANQILEQFSSQGVDWKLSTYIDSESEESYLEIVAEFLGDTQGGKGRKFHLATFIEMMKWVNLKSLQETPTLLALENSFHGKTLSALGITAGENYRIPLQRMGIPSVFIDANRPQDLAKIFDTHQRIFYEIGHDGRGSVTIKKRPFSGLLAFFAEPLQGEGGIRPISAEFFKVAQTHCRQWGIPLIFDEIQCGMGRTGTFLYSEQLGVFADYYLLSKSLGGGLSKVSALMIEKSHYQEEFGIVHSSTFAEDAYSSSLAVETLEIITDEPDFMEGCRVKGEYLFQKLKKVHSKFPKVIKEIRGVGLMIGIEFQYSQEGESVVIHTLFDQALIGYIIMGYLLNEHHIRVAPSLSHCQTIRLEPSATLTFAECDQVIIAIERLAEIITKANAYELIKSMVGRARPHSTDPIADFRKNHGHGPGLGNDHWNSQGLLKNKKSSEGVVKVGFIGHLIEARDLALADQSFSLFSDKELTELMERGHSLFGPHLSYQNEVQSKTGETILFHFYGLFLDSQSISSYINKKSTALVLDKIKAAKTQAEKDGCSYIGLGGYTSIISNNGKFLSSQKLKVTTGNSFTVAMGIESLLKGAQQAEINLNTATFAALGAAGNICQVYSQLMSEHVSRLILIGKSVHKKQIDLLIQEIYERAWKQFVLEIPGRGILRILGKTQTFQKLLKTENLAMPVGEFLQLRLQEELGDRVPVFFSENVEDIIQADLILGASNSPSPLIYPSMLKEGPVVICDVALPADTHPSVVEEKTNALVIQGGIVKLPFNSDFQVPGLPLEKGHAFACMSETMLLGLSRINENYSYGKLNADQVKKISEVGKIHGFELGAFKNERSF